MENNDRLFGSNSDDFTDVHWDAFALLGEIAFNANLVARRNNDKAGQVGNFGLRLFMSLLKVPRIFTEPLPFHNEDLSCLIGCNVSSASKALKDLERNGYVRVGGGKKTRSLVLQIPETAIAKYDRRYLDMPPHLQNEGSVSPEPPINVSQAIQLLDKRK